MLNYLQVGKIINTHGVRGEVKVIPLTDDPERFKKLKDVYIVSKDNTEDSLVENSNVLTICGVKISSNKIILKFKDIEKIEEAEKLKAHFIVIHRKDAVSLPEDRFFICDLEGCDVFDEADVYYGSIDRVIQTGSNDVYCVVDKNKKEILIPALKSVVKSVDIKRKKIIVKIPEGLL